MTAVSEADVEAFYLRHRARFVRPERRTLRHILVTINEDLPGSGREAARDRIEAIRARLAPDAECFAAEALRHSECPSALHGGLLGKIARGMLYAEIEAAAFALAPGEVSGVVESSLGFHLVRCDAVDGEAQLTLAETSERIRAYLVAKVQRARASSRACAADGQRPR